MTRACCNPYPLSTLDYTRNWSRPIWPVKYYLFGCRPHSVIKILRHPFTSGKRTVTAFPAWISYQSVAKGAENSGTLELLGLSYHRNNTCISWNDKFCGTPWIITFVPANAYTISKQIHETQACEMKSDVCGKWERENDISNKGSLSLDSSHFGFGHNNNDDNLINGMLKPKKAPRGKYNGSIHRIFNIMVEIVQLDSFSAWKSVQTWSNGRRYSLG